MLPDDPLWYKDAIIYELHVRAFHDSVGDGVGDFRGLTSKLDYLQDLGVTAIWLLPFYPSPLRDEGYDIADYTKVNPIYGDLSDFENFLREARQQVARLLRLERHAGEIQGSAHHLQGSRAVQLDLGSGRPGLFLAPFL